MSVSRSLIRSAAAFRRCFASNTSVNARIAGSPAAVLEFVNGDAPVPAANQVAIKILAAPITAFDLAAVKGLRAGAAGNEGVGVVTSVGSDVTNFKVNDTVVPVSSGLGTWSQHVVADASSVARIPSDIPAEQAAMLSGSACIAYRLLADFASLKEGDTIIQNDAKSPIGKAVIQLAKSRGVKTINVIPDHPDIHITTEHLQAVGADIVIAESYLNSAKYKRLVADQGAPKLGLNCRGGKTSGDLAKSLGEGATMVTYGSNGAAPVSVPTSTLLDKDLTLRGFSYPKYLEAASAAEKSEMVASVSGLVQDGTLTSYVLSTDFANFFEALTEAEFEFAERATVVTME